MANKFWVWDPDYSDSWDHAALVEADSHQEAALERSQVWDVLEDEALAGNVQHATVWVATEPGGQGDVRAFSLQVEVRVERFADEINPRAK